MGEKAESQTAGEAIEAGRIEFVMHGERLKGRFALIRMRPRGKGKPQWLLMKGQVPLHPEQPSATTSRTLWA